MSTQKKRTKSQNRYPIDLKRKIVKEYLSGRANCGILGYMHIPSKGQKIRPNENAILKIAFRNITKKLNNSAHNRIFGMTFRYK